MNESVISLCQLFLVPVSILLGALGVATTPQLKTLVSIMGLIVSGMWALRVWLLPVATPNEIPLDGIPAVDARFALALATIFAIAYVISASAHGIEWLQKRKSRKATKG